MDQKETAGKTFELALQAAGKIEKNHSKAHAMADIAEKLSRAGFHKRTHEVLDEADLVADKIREPDLQQQTIQKVRTLMGTLPKPE